MADIAGAATSPSPSWATMHTLTLFTHRRRCQSSPRTVQYSTFSSVPTATKQTPFLSLLSVQCYTFLSVSINVHGAGSDRSSLPRPSPSTIARRIVSSSEEGLAFPSPSSFARGGRAVAVSVASRSLSLSLLLRPFSTLLLPPFFLDHRLSSFSSPSSSDSFFLRQKGGRKGVGGSGGGWAYSFSSTASVEGKAFCAMSFLLLVPCTHALALSLSLAACAERVGEEEKRVLLSGLTRKTRGLRFLPLRFPPLGWGRRRRRETQQRE